MDKSIMIVEDFTFDTPKTKEFKVLQNSLKISDKKVLLVLANQNKSIYLSSRNLKTTKVVIATELTTYDIMNAQSVVMQESSVGIIEKNLG